MNANGASTTIATFVALVLGAIGVSTVSSAQVQSVISGAMALVVILHGLLAHLTKRNTNAAAVAAAQARAATAASSLAAAKLVTAPFVAQATAAQTLTGSTASSTPVDTSTGKHEATT